MFVPMQTPQLNLLLAWLGTLLGFLSGLYLGLNFQRDDWLGGYGSFKRRLYRLGHISFFGLAAVNFMFYFTVHSLGAFSPSVVAASWAFVAGAVSMPLCCLLMAHFPRTHLLFGLPVTSLITGAVLTVLLVARSGLASVPDREPSRFAAAPTTRRSPAFFQRLTDPQSSTHHHP